MELNILPLLNNMKPLEQKIIDKYIERFNYLKTLIPEGDCDFEQIKEFILTSIQQAYEAGRKSNLIKQKEGRYEK